MPKHLNAQTSILMCYLQFRKRFSEPIHTLQRASGLPEFLCERGLEAAI